MDDLAEIEWRQRSIDDAKEALECFIESRWPVGSPVIWMKGGHLQYGEVVACGSSSLRVRNDMTGKNYWIDLYWVKEALKDIKQRKAA